MIPKQILILIVALYGSLALGFIFPAPSAAVSDYIGPMMMVILFLSYLKLSPRDIWRQINGDPLGPVIGCVVKLVVMPAAAYGIALLVYPRMGLGLVLIGGCSTAVAAPFFVSMAEGSMTYSLIMAAVSSLLMPLTLPAMIHLLIGAELSFDLAALAWFLIRLIFIPLIVAFLVRRFLPAVDHFFSRIASLLSLVLITIITFGVLGRYVDFLTSELTVVWMAVSLSSTVALISILLGWLGATRRTWSVEAAAAGSQVFMNNAIPIALGVHLNDPYTTILSAAYFFPLYAAVVAGAWIGAHIRQSN